MAGFFIIDVPVFQKTHTENIVKGFSKNRVQAIRHSKIYLLFNHTVFFFFSGKPHLYKMRGQRMDTQFQHFFNI